MEAERRAGPEPHLAGLVHEHLTLAQVLESRELGAVAHDGRRDARLDARSNYFLGGTRGGPRVERRVHLAGAHEPAEHRPQLAVFGHVVTADHARQRLPLLGGDGGDADEAAIAGGFVAGDHHPAAPARPPTGKPRHQGRRGHERHLERLEHRHVDDLRHGRARRAVPRGDGAERGERAGDVLAEIAGDGQRREFGVAVIREASTARLQHLLGADEAVVGPAVSDRRDRDRHQRVGTRRGTTGLADDYEVG